MKPVVIASLVTMLDNLVTATSIPIARTPPAPGLQPTLEPRDDGSLDTEALLEAVLSQESQYARIEMTRSVAELNRGNKAIHQMFKEATKGHDVTETYVPGYSPWHTIDIRSPPPPQGPIGIPLKASSTTSLKDFGWRGDSFIVDQHTNPFRTMFDTTAAYYSTPSKDCGPEDGCAGPSARKYQEGGVLLPVSDDLSTYRSKVDLIE